MPVAAGFTGRCIHSKTSRYSGLRRKPPKYDIPKVGAQGHTYDHT